MVRTLKSKVLLIFRAGTIRIIDHVIESDTNGDPSQINIKIQMQSAIAKVDRKIKSTSCSSNYII